MKNFLTIVLALLSTSAFAQQPAFSEGDMNAMMGKMQEMQACMSKVDQKKLKELKKKGEAMHKKVKSLCDAGKKDEAQEQALEFGIKMKDDPEIAKMRECTKDMPEMMKQMQKSNVTDMDKEFTQKDICEAMKEKK